MTQTKSLFLGGLGLILLGFVLGYGIQQSQPSPPDAGTEFDKLAQAFDIIQSEYVEPVSPDTLAASGIRGLVRPLDDHSQYLGREKMQYVQEAFDGSFEGIGITYDVLEGPRGQDTLIVQTVVPGGPSEEAGLRAGDRILSVNGEEALGWSHKRIRSQFKGPRGSTVKVRIRRPGRAQPFDTTIERGVVPLRTLEAAYMMEEHTGYLRLRRFAQTTGREVSEGIRQLEAKGMQRLVLDLRGNAGGVMDAAAAVADEFLVEGQQIVSARSRHRGYRQTETASSEGAFQKGPLIILVDEQSASASEIVAGALQDHDRAFIVGRPTFGKGSVQRQFKFSDQTGLRLTIAHFFTPSGRRLQPPSDSLRSASSEGTGSPSNHTSAPRDSVGYTTDAGRRVRGRGGIYPDRRVKTEAHSSDLASLEEGGVVEAFARRWIDARADSLRAKWADRPEAFAKEFSLPTSVIPSFIQYAKAGESSRVPDSQFTSTSSQSLATLRQGSQTAFKGLEPGESFREWVTVEITSYVGRRLFGTSMWIRVRNTVDPIVTEALHSWEAAEEMAAKYPIE